MNLALKESEWQFLQTLPTPKVYAGMEQRATVSFKSQKLNPSCEKPGMALPSVHRAVRKLVL